MSSRIYSQLTQLLAKWPIDSSKKGRDLGECIRKKISANFPQGEATKVNIAEWFKFSAHLTYIADDRALKKYPRKKSSSSTGLSAQECREVVSTDFLNYLVEQDKSSVLKTKN